MEAHYGYPCQGGEGGARLEDQVSVMETGGILWNVVSFSLTSKQEEVIKSLCFWLWDRHNCNNLQFEYSVSVGKPTDHVVRRSWSIMHCSFQLDNNWYEIWSILSMPSPASLWLVLRGWGVVLSLAKAEALHNTDSGAEWMGQVLTQIS